MPCCHPYGVRAMWSVRSRRGRLGTAPGSLGMDAGLAVRFLARRMRLTGGTAAGIHTGTAHRACQRHAALPWLYSYTALYTIQLYSAIQRYTAYMLYIIPLTRPTAEGWSGALGRGHTGPVARCRSTWCSVAVCIS